MKGAFYYSVKYAATARKPRLMMRLADKVVRAAITRKPILRYVDVCVTTKCNLTCLHCFATSFQKHGRNVLAPPEWRDIAEQSMRLGCVTFGITGGEPLVHDQLVEVVRNLAPERNLISINTNGTLLTEPKARELYRAGVDVLQFSMDSADAAEHDAFRNKAGAFAELKNAIDISRRVGLKVTIVCTLSHKNARSDGVRRLVDYAKREKLLLILSRAVPAGRWLANDDILMTEDDFAHMYDIVGKHAHVRTDMDSNYACYGCSAATEKLYVTAYGDVIPCPFMHIVFGNVREDRVATIRDRMLSVPCLSSYSNKCHVAEDRNFIEHTLSKTFDRPDLANWRECFGEQADALATRPPLVPKIRELQEATTHAPSASCGCEESPRLVSLGTDLHKYDHS